MGTYLFLHFNKIFFIEENPMVVSMLLYIDLNLLRKSAWNTIVIILM